MAAIDTAELSVCTDCILYLANGEVTDSHGNDIAAEIGERINARIPVNADIVPGSEELGFSWTSCDSCGSELGGDRHEAAYLYFD